MAVTQPPDQLEELSHLDEMLLQELRRVDEMLLEELKRIDEMLLRIVGAIDQLPEGVVSALTREQLGPLSGNGTRAAAPARSRVSTRPFDPYGEEEVEAVDYKESAATQITRRVKSWVTAYAPDREALSFATLSLAVAVLATAIAVIGLVVAVLQ